MSDLHLFQARWQLGLLTPGEVPDAATALLASGVDGPALRRLAGITHPTYWEVVPLVERAIREASLPALPAEDALWLLVYDAAERIVTGDVAPFAGAAAIAARSAEMGLPEPLRYFTYLWGDYGESPNGPAWFDEQIRREAAELLARRATECEDGQA